MGGGAVIDRILLVEDEPLVADMVRLNLEHAGFKVETVADGKLALDRLRTEGYDLALLDVMLPSLDGYEVARGARSAGVVTPILMLTARADTSAKVLGFEAGADDYLAKPFAMPELIARARALIRRHQAPRGVPSSREVRLGNYTANLDSREASSNDGRVLLTETECSLLAYLAAHEGETLTRTEILENAWGMDRFPTERTVDNYVMRLRRLFEPEPDAPRYFLTLRGKGYRFVREG